MSKKLLSTNRWKRYLASRQSAEMKKAHRRKISPRPRSMGRRAPFNKRRTIELIAPNNFSFVGNPDETLRFLNDVNSLSQKYNLMLQVDGVTKITTDAIAALIASIHSIPDGTVIRGSFPRDAACREVLIQSGFFSHVRSTQTIPPIWHGQILQKKSNTVHPEIARELIRSGTSAMFGSYGRSPHTYRALIECMNNTHNHASRQKQEKETWWATVYADLKRKRLCYTFVDTGVGIFRSVRLGVIRNAYKLLRLRTDADILRDILNGNVESSTGLTYRGKGLPSMNALFRSGRLKSFVIISNDVYADVGQDDFRIMDTSFKGTLIYWETE
jgi:hypothetical protein